METDNYEGMPKIQKKKKNFKCDFLYCVYKFTYSVPMIIFRALYNMLELFYETFYRLKAVKYFCQVDPLLVFDRVRNTTLGFRSGNVCKAVKNKNFHLKKFRENHREEFRYYMNLSYEIQRIYFCDSCLSVRFYRNPISHFIIMCADRNIWYCAVKNALDFKM